MERGEQVISEPKRERGKERLQEALTQMEGIGKDMGPEAARMVVQAFAKRVEEGEWRPLEKQELLEIPDRSVFQREVLSELQKQGAVKEEEDGTLLVDTDRLFRTKLSAFHRRRSERTGETFGTDVPFVETFGKNKREFFANAFYGRIVRLKEENGKKSDPRPLFYLPLNRQEAMDPARINEASFHFGLWEIPTREPIERFNPAGASNPGAFDKLKFLEASIAAVLYHPSYGDGKRDARGRLVVRETQGGAYKLFSGEWLAKQGLGFSDAEGGSILLKDKPLETIEKHAPELFRRHLLERSDFRLRREHREGADALRVSQTGTVTYRGVRYSLGREFEGKEVRIESLGGDLGVIIDVNEQGVWRIAATMKLFEKDREYPGVPRRKTKTGSFLDVPKMVCGPEKFDARAFRQSRAGEDLRQFQNRLGRLEHIEQVVALENWLARETDVRLSDLRADLYKRLVSNPAVLSACLEYLPNYVKKVGLPGLEVFALVSDSSIATTLISVVDRLPKGEEQRFLSTFRMSAEARLHTEEQIFRVFREGGISEARAGEARYELRTRLSSLLEAESARLFSQDLVKRADALPELDRQHADFCTFAGLFREVFKGNKEAVDIRELHDITYTRVAPEDLSVEDKVAMRRIHWNNWAGQEASAKILQASFEKALESGLRDFFVMKQEGRVVGFARFDYADKNGTLLPPKETYFGSFNIDASVRGSAIGEVMLRNMFDTMSDMTIRLESDTKHDISSKYVEDGKAVITSVARRVDDTPDDIFLMTTSPDIRTKSAGQKLSKEDIVAGKEERVRVFSVSSRELAADIIERETKAGKVVSRFFRDGTNFYVVSETAF